MVYPPVATGFEYPRCLRGLLRPSEGSAQGLPGAPGRWGCLRDQFFTNTLAFHVFPSSNFFPLLKYVGATRSSMRRL